MRASNAAAVVVAVAACSVFVHGGVSTPIDLTDALPEVAKHWDLRDIEVMHIHTSGEAKYGSDPRFK